LNVSGGGRQDTAVEEPGVAEAGKYNEAPILALLVAAGELPPVEERLPPEPISAQVLGIGKHGGILRVFSRPGRGYVEEFNVGLQYYSRSWTGDGTYVPGLMTDVQFSDDWKNLTFYIRPGVRWSDGAPVTMEDYLFTFNDLQLNPDVKIWGLAGGNFEPPVQLDEWTFRINLTVPQPKMLEGLATTGGSVYGGIMPKHYLEKWHADYNEEAQKLAVEEGFDHWYEALNNHFWWSPTTDIDRPNLTPWIFTRLDTVTKISERNPYYAAVDSAGNQLPYIDKIVEQVVDPEVVNLKLISGEADIEYLLTTFPNFTLYKENEKANNYTVYEMEGPVAGNLDLWLKGIAHSDPAKRKLYQNENFRKALSHAINREEINDIVFLGKGIPRQATVNPNEPYYKPEWAKVAADYDPEKANRLLDEAGLAKMDGDGFRLDFDGNPFVIVIEYPTGRQQTEDALELIKEYWEEVGVKVLIKAVAIQLFWEHGDQLEIEIASGTALHNFNVWRFGRNWHRYLDAQSQIARGLKKLEDFTDGKLPGEEPPQWVEDYWNWYNDTTTIPNYSPEYNELATKLLDYNAEHTLFIGTVGLVPYLIVAKNYVKNVPTKFPPTYAWGRALSEYLSQIYIEK
jgi:peptide/nickel transport system substrate-binding protein